MQKTLRINLLARNQAVKRARERKARKTFEDWAEYKKEDDGREKILRRYVKEERAHRREDWKLGPLAPNRDVGKEKGRLGSIDYNLSTNPAIPYNIRRSPHLPGYSIMNTVENHPKYPQFKGKTIVGNVVTGDRVVIVKGPARIRGQIGLVSETAADKEELKISNVNINDVAKPSMLMTEPTKDDPSPDNYISQEGWIPMEYVRLVVRDEVSGTEYIVSQLHADGPYVQRKFEHHLPSHTRYITGSEQWSKDGNPIEIPWPKDTAISELRSTAADSELEGVRAQTWDPSIYYSPLGYKIEYNSAKVPDAKDAYLAGYEKNSSLPFGLSGFVSRDKADERQRRIAQSIMGEFRGATNRPKATHNDNHWVNRKMMEDARSIWWRDRKILTPEELKAQLGVQQAQEAREAQITAISEKAAAEKLAEAQGKVQEIEENAREAIEKIDTLKDTQNKENEDVMAMTISVLKAEVEYNALKRQTEVLYRLQETLEDSSKILLDPATEELIQRTRQTALDAVYSKADKKLSKKLRHLLLPKQVSGTESQLNA